MWGLQAHNTMTMLNILLALEMCKGKSIRYTQQRRLLQLYMAASKKPAQRILCGSLLPGSALLGCLDLGKAVTLGGKQPETTYPMCQLALDGGTGGPQGRCRRTETCLQGGTADTSETCLMALIFVCTAALPVISITEWIHSSSASFSVYV